MIVATQPYGKSDFEYPEVILNPFKASTISIIKQGGDYLKQEEAEEENDKNAIKTEQNTNENSDKATPPIPNVIKPFPLKMEPVSKKAPATIDVPIERTEPQNNYAPIPVHTAPVGQ